MADLLTIRELALWTSNEESDVEADPLAHDVISKVSQMATFIGGQPTWSLAGETKAPFDVLMVVLQVAKRCYENTKQVVQEGGVGPIGGDRVLDAAALLLSLTDSERATLAKYNPDGDPDNLPDGLFTITTTRGSDSTLVPATLYVSDSQQVGMDPSQSAYPSWDIPMFSPGDPGDPNLYEVD